MVMRHQDDPNMGPSPCGYYGWSITVGELRKAIEGVPDEYEVMLEDADVDDCEISSIRVNHLYPPFEGAPGLLVMGGGQIVTYEYGYEERMDISFGDAPERTKEELRALKSKFWDTERGEWWE